MKLRKFILTLAASTITINAFAINEGHTKIDGAESGNANDSSTLTVYK